MQPSAIRERYARNDPALHGNQSGTIYRDIHPVQLYFTAAFHHQFARADKELNLRSGGYVY